MKTDELVQERENLTESKRKRALETPVLLNAKTVKNSASILSDPNREDDQELFTELDLDICYQNR